MGGFSASGLEVPNPPLRAGLQEGGVVHLENEMNRRVAPVPEAPHRLDLLSGDQPPTPRSGVSRPLPEGAEKQRFVMIVEDEPDALEAMSELLSDEGFKTLQARHGQEALDLLNAGWRPALILLDIKMPVMDGNDFLRALLSDPKLAEIPVAIMTASAGADRTPSRKRDAGFFRKPVDYERLLQTIRFYCG
jgi:two-component system, chemotaxis family, chemotaxis protein CheY